MNRLSIVDPEVKKRRQGILFPLELQLPAPPGLYGGTVTKLALRSGLTTLVGPNGTGKTQILRLLRDPLRQQAGIKNVRLLAAGRSAPFENFRGAIGSPGMPGSDPAAVGHRTHQGVRWSFESITGDLLALERRADLLVKVEARLQVLFRRRLRLQWTQGGLQLSFVSNAGEEYPVNVEASGVLQLVGLIAALHDDEVGALLIDEPEISLHPQLQAFLLQEVRQMAGNPYDDPGKKLIVLSTHAPSFLTLRRLEQISDMVFFTTKDTPPRQIPHNAGELQNRKLAALIARLSESHRLAFFAQTVLLVEGPSDEIILNGLASRLEWPMAGAGAQIIPVTGKGEMSETTKLFRLMGKKAVVMADLDALADDNTIVNTFAQAEGAREAATRFGHNSLTDLDKSVRGTLGKMVVDHWAEIAPLAQTHPYIMYKATDTPEDVARRRAVLAVVLSRSETDLGALPLGEEWIALRHRFTALLNALEDVGCFVLRRGTIEDYYLRSTRGRSTGKPENAADEAAAYGQEEEATLRQQYDDVLRVIAYAAPVSRVDENQFLRGMLGGFLATAFQHLRSGTPDNELNALAAGSNPSSLSVFRLENVSAQNTLTLRVHIVSSLFPRSGFPFDIRYDENLNALVAQKLPSG